jgi:hypothetical protein
LSLRGNKRLRSGGVFSDIYVGACDFAAGVGDSGREGSHDFVDNAEK